MLGLGNINRMGLAGNCDACALVNLNGFGAVSDYDQIVIGGKTYSVNQIVDKTITANANLTAYSSPGGKVLFKITSGQIIGKVFSYLRPDQTSDGRAWLMFEKTYNNYFYVPADGAATKPLKDQGALTVAEEIEIEKDKEEKQNDPVSYYLKKFGVPVFLIGGGIYLAGALGKEFVKAKLSKPKAELSGHKKKK